MALVVLPEGTQISGSIGGTTWSHNRFGAYKRNRTVPVNPRTARQVAIRNIQQQLTIEWNNVLTQAQRDAWNVYAANVVWLNKLGQSVNLTGLNHYLRSNAPRLQNGLSRLLAAPVLFTLAVPEQLLVVTASVATQDLSVAFDNSTTAMAEAGAFESVSMGLPQNAARTFFGSPYRNAGVILGDPVPPVTPAVIAAPFVFGIGQRIWIRTRIGRADGRLSEFAEVNFLSTA